ncbi:DUF1572 family protein [Marixanthomonas spongiae]|uniref:DUF1572 domain-containing protein n=1 Tax=Marixanthomonas spongiae TaxID=2174845 RepID=A0A2U0I8L8_9FLAO|nr:DUF1572 family protein [Marixanthomonas spongiae]PVW17447.1 hypothetical protein DDV96_01545 [Marixanthomonas spongiae]
MQADYLNSVTKQFEYYKLLGERTFDQLEEHDLLWQFNEQSNSIAVIVNHLYGNMKSRWTDFLITDGEKKWRNRDLEFENVIKTKKECYFKWEEGWECLFTALRTINNDNFETQVYIRNQSHSIVAAINRQLAHYAYHIGQIVFIGRMLKGEQWKSLSISKGKSTDFNTAKFSKGKHDGHFTDDLT